MQLGDIDLPPHIVQELVSLQGAELVRLKEQLRELKLENERYKLRVGELEDTEVRRRELRELVRAVVAEEGYVSARAQPDRANAPRAEDPEVEQLRERLARVEHDRDGLLVKLVAVESRAALVKAPTESDGVSQADAAHRKQLEDEIALHKAEVERLHRAASSDLAKAQDDDWTLDEAVRRLKIYLGDDVKGKPKEEHEAVGQLSLEVLESRLESSMDALRKDFGESKAREATSTESSAEFAFARGPSTSLKSATDGAKADGELPFETVLGGLKARMAPRPVPSSPLYSEAGSLAAPVVQKATVEVEEDPAEKVFTALAVSNLSQGVVEGIAKTLHLKSIRVVDRRSFVWAKCPDTAFFVHPSVQVTKDGQQNTRENQAMERLRQAGNCNMVLRVTDGRCFYIGSYMIAEAKPLSVAEFKKLPELAQQGVVSATGYSGMHGAIREMYLSGEIAAVKYPTRRIGYNGALYARLRDIPATPSVDF